MDTKKRSINFVESLPRLPLVLTSTMADPLIYVEPTTLSTKYYIEQGTIPQVTTYTPIVYAEPSISLINTPIVIHQEQSHLNVAPNIVSVVTKTKSVSRPKRKTPRIVVEKEHGILDGPIITEPKTPESEKNVTKQRKQSCTTPIITEISSTIVEQELNRRVILKEPTLSISEPCVSKDSTISSLTNTFSINSSISEQQPLKVSSDCSENPEINVSRSIVSGIISNLVSNISEDHANSNLKRLLGTNISLTRDPSFHTSANIPKNSSIHLTDTFSVNPSTIPDDICFHIPSDVSEADSDAQISQSFVDAMNSDDPTYPLTPSLSFDPLQTEALENNTPLSPTLSLGFLDDTTSLSRTPSLSFLDSLNHPRTVNSLTPLMIPEDFTLPFQPAISEELIELKPVKPHNQVPIIPIPLTPIKDLKDTLYQEKIVTPVITTTITAVNPEDTANQKEEVIPMITTTITAVNPEDTLNQKEKITPAITTTINAVDTKTTLTFSCSSGVVCSTGLISDEACYQPLGSNELNKEEEKLTSVTTVKAKRRYIKRKVTRTNYCNLSSISSDRIESSKGEAASVHLLKTNKGAAKLCRHGYTYVKSNAQNQRIYWVCAKRRQLKCKGCLVTDDKLFVVKTTPHCHDPLSEKEIEMIRARNLIRETARSSKCQTPADIFKKVLSRLPSKTRAVLPRPCNLKRIIRYQAGYCQRLTSMGRSITKVENVRNDQTLDLSDLADLTTDADNELQNESTRNVLEMPSLATYTWDSASWPILRRVSTDEIDRFYVYNSGRTLLWISKSDQVYSFDTQGFSRSNLSEVCILNGQGVKWMHVTTDLLLALTAGNTLLGLPLSSENFYELTEPVINQRSIRKVVQLYSSPTQLLALNLQGQILHFSDYTAGKPIEPLNQKAKFTDLATAGSVGLALCTATNSLYTFHFESVSRSYIVAMVKLKHRQRDNTGAIPRLKAIYGTGSEGHFLLISHDDKLWQCSILASTYTELLKYTLIPVQLPEPCCEVFTGPHVEFTLVVVHSGDIYYHRRSNQDSIVKLTRTSILSVPDFLYLHSQHEPQSAVLTRLPSPRAPPLYFNNPVNLDLFKVYIRGRLIYASRGYIQSYAQWILHLCASTGSNVVHLDDYPFSAYYHYLSFLHFQELPVELDLPEAIQLYHLALTLKHLDVKIAAETRLARHGSHTLNDGLLNLYTNFNTHPQLANIIDPTNKGVNCELKQQLKAIIVDQMTVSNCCNVYRAFKEHKDYSLLDKVIEFIAKHQNWVILGPAYASLDSALCKQLSIDICRVASKSKVL